MKLLQTLAPGFLLILLALANTARTAELKSDESLILFPGFARLTDDGRSWETTVRGWVFEPERRTAPLAALRKALGIEDTELNPEANAIFNERAHPFLYDNERGKRFALRIGDRTFASDKSNADGHFMARLRLTAEEMKAQYPVTQHALRITVHAQPGNNRPPVTADLFLLRPDGVSVISDIDDTIKISEVLDRKALLRNTFLKPFAPVPGMAAVYESWATNAGAQFHYVSACPWQLYRPLDEFLKTNGFPAGTFHMKSFRWKDRSFLQLFSSPIEYKLGVIEPLLKQFPRRRFVLVGDSGEKDPEIYARLARKYPGQIVRILIRDVTNEGPKADRYRSILKGLPPDLWTILRESSEP